MTTEPIRNFPESKLASKKVQTRAGLESSSPCLHPIRYGIGCDVHKDKITVCVKAQLQDASLLEIRTHTFTATPKGLAELTQFVRKYQPIAHFLMECTGIYHLPLYFHLCSAFPELKDRIIAMNPLMVNRKLTEFGNKHDKADARGMATLTFYDGLLKSSYIGTPEFLALRDLMRAYHRNRSQTTRLKNRIHRLLCTCNQKFPFNLNQEWCIAVLTTYVSADISLKEAVLRTIDRLKTQHQATGIIEKHLPEIEPYEMIHLPEDTRFHLCLLLQQFHYEDMIGAVTLERVEKSILNDPTFKWAYENLLSIPGCGSVTALSVLTELGDYNRFKSWREMAKFAGVVPNIDESAGIRHKGHINRQTNRNLRFAMCQAATVLLNCNDDSTDLTEFAFRQIHLKKLPFKKAMIKVAQKLIRVIFHILVLKIPYCATYEKQIRDAEKRARIFARKQSYLESMRTRALKRDIQTFLVSNSELLSAKSRYHLVHGFTTLLDRVKRLNPSSSPKGQEE